MFSDQGFVLSRYMSKYYTKTNFDSPATSDMVAFGAHFTKSGKKLTMIIPPFTFCNNFCNYIHIIIMSNQYLYTVGV